LPRHALLRRCAIFKRSSNLVSVDIVRAAGRGLGGGQQEIDASTVSSSSDKSAAKRSDQHNSLTVLAVFPPPNVSNVLVVILTVEQ